MALHALSLVLALFCLTLPDGYEPQPGDKAHLEFGESFETAVPAAPTLAVFERMRKEVLATGDEALPKLSVDDTIWGVDNFTAVEVVNTDTGIDSAVEVRFLDGPFEARKAFVPRKLVFKGKPPHEPFPENGYSFKEKRKVMAAWLRMMKRSYGLGETKGKDGSSVDFEKAQKELYDRLNLAPDKAKSIMVEMLVKKVHFGKALVDDNPQADRYVVTSSLELFPNPFYKPTVGDEVYLYNNSVFASGERVGEHKDLPLCTDFLSYKGFEKVLLAHDPEGLTELKQRGTLFYARTGTKVRLLEIRESPTAEEHAKRESIEVRVLSGPLTGGRYWVSASWVARLISKEDLEEMNGDFVTRGSPPEPDTMAPRKPESTEEKRDNDATRDLRQKEAESSAQAASLLRSARNLERTGKRSRALNFYLMILKKFPDSPQSKIAAERIDVLRRN